MDIGTIKMQTPGGKPSAITISLTETGAVDMHFSRSSEGEVSIRLPKFAAQQLGDLLVRAAAALDAPCHADVLLEIANKNRGGEQ